MKKIFYFFGIAVTVTLLLFITTACSDAGGGGVGGGGGGGGGGGDGGGGGGGGGENENYINPFPREAAIALADDALKAFMDLDEVILNYIMDYYGYPPLGSSATYNFDGDVSGDIGGIAIIYNYTYRLFTNISGKTSGDISFSVSFNNLTDSLYPNLIIQSGSGDYTRNWAEYDISSNNTKNRYFNLYSCNVRYTYGSQTYNVTVSIEYYNKEKLYNNARGTTVAVLNGPTYSF